MLVVVVSYFNGTGFGFMVPIYALPSGSIYHEMSKILVHLYLIMTTYEGQVGLDFFVELGTLGISLWLLVVIFS